VAIVGGPAAVAFKLALTNGFGQTLETSAKLAREGEPARA
jgi:hypothetical protein